MVKLPDFSELGYKVIKKLGRARFRDAYGGLSLRASYLAKNTRNQQLVVIKQIQFGKHGSDLSEYRADDREIALLRSLDHPNIPRYLDSFYASTGFCMVQDYIDAQPPFVQPSLSPDKIKHIAIQVLEVLVYLQQQIPPVVHKNIKPENILIDDQLNVYLVDFGLVGIGGREEALNSAIAGTPGFMPPEQLSNHQLTEASDLYSLGITLLCLLTGTKTDRVDILTQHRNSSVFNRLLPKISLQFISWLKKMIQPNLDERFPNASAALIALETIESNRTAKAQLSRKSLEFVAEKIGEKLTKTVMVTNPVPCTRLDGKWSVALNSNDPPHQADRHPWISVTPSKFKKDRIKCTITVNTEKLMTDEVYYRQLLLHNSSSTETQTLTIKVQTASLESNTKNLLDWEVISQLVIDFLSWLALTVIIGKHLSINNQPDLYLLFLGVFTIFAIIFNLFEDWLAKWSIFKSLYYAYTGAICGYITGGIPGAIIVGIGLLVWNSNRKESRSIIAILMRKGFSKYFCTGFLILLMGLAVSLGIILQIKFTNPVINYAAKSISSLLALMILYPTCNRAILISKYRNHEERLIKP